jgi:nucleotide-binding universal stress UspA family protein
MNILIPVDGSEYTIRAVDFVIAHFDWFQGAPTLRVLHVEAPIPDRRARAAAGHEAVEKYYEEESRAALAPAEALLRKSGIAFDSGYVVGDVAGQIQEAIRQHQIDMVVMGSHGHGALKSLIMGSVTARVLALTSVPVLLIR